MKAKKGAAKKGAARKGKASKAAAKGKAKAVKRAAPKTVRKATRAVAPDRFDHTFRAIYDHEIPWESDDVRGLLKLPSPAQCASSPAAKQRRHKAHQRAVVTIALQFID